MLSFYFVFGTGIVRFYTCYDLKNCVDFILKDI